MTTKLGSISRARSSLASLALATALASFAGCAYDATPEGTASRVDDLSTKRAESLITPVTAMPAARATTRVPLPAATSIVKAPPVLTVMGPLE